MDTRIGYIKREILACGSVDWVHAADIIAFAREAYYGKCLGGDPDEVFPIEELAATSDERVARQEREALPLAIVAVKELLHEGLVQIGDTADTKFIPWRGTEEQLDARIDEVASDARFPLLPGHLFWLRNTLREE